MVADISDRLKNVLAKKDKWNRRIFTEILLLIMRRNIKSWVQWDDDSGELWARILIDEKVIAVISLLHPLVLLNNNLNEHLVAQLEDDVVIIKYNDYDSQEFSVNKEVYYQLFKERWRDEVSDHKKFSANDLYFQSST